MVSTRNQRGPSTSNAADHKVSPPVKLATKASKSKRQPSRRHVRVASSDAGPAEQVQPAVGNGVSEPGLRERLLSLPVELFGEICSFLDAIELRSLSLTDETFWSVLVSEKSDPIWRQAFKRTVPPMPDCPEAMSGPYYAQVMLVESCMICQAKSWTMSLDYFHRVRYCNTCRQSNIISENAVLELHPDFPREFLKYLSAEAVSSDGATLTMGYFTGHESHPQYLKVTVEGVYELWKSLSDTADSPELANTRLIERLKKYADDRIRSGMKMRDWQNAASQLRAAELTRLRNERSEMILTKLSELGYLQVDFPRWHSEVYKSEALTDQGWERIRPIVVEAAESNKTRRILNETRMRKNRRSRDLTLLWNNVVAVASGTRAVYMAERGACPMFREFLDLAPVAALLEADTDGIPEQELEAVRPDALQFAIQGRRRYLVKLRNIRDGQPLDELNDQDWSTLSDNETIARLDNIAAELVHAVNGFWDPTRKTVDWYPSARLSGPNADLTVLAPAEALAPGMISKVLEAIGKEPNAEAGAVTSGDWGRKPVLYRCARCDERVAPHLTFTETVSHFLENKVWFDKASDAREKAFIASSGSNDPPPYSTIFNDHDWNAEGDLIASDNSRDKARVTKLQNQLEAAYGNDPEDYDGEDFTTRSRRSTNKVPERRVRRICRLCPEGFSPQPMYFAALKVHIEHIHCKVANVEQDTAVFNPHRDSAPANPWVFDVQFLSL